MMATARQTGAWDRAVQAIGVAAILGIAGFSWDTSRRLAVIEKTVEPMSKIEVKVQALEIAVAKLSVNDEAIRRELERHQPN